MQHYKSHMDKDWIKRFEKLVWSRYLTRNTKCQDITVYSLERVSSWKSIGKPLLHLKTSFLKVRFAFQTGLRVAPLHLVADNAQASMIASWAAVLPELKNSLGKSICALLVTDSSAVAPSLLPNLS